MPVPHLEAPAYLASHAGVLGKQWTEVDTLEGLDPDEYELEEEEEYITLDLGPEMDPKYLQTEGTYQLIGMDTPLPHLKIGNTILHGQVTPLIGTEIILGLIRNEENPLRPSHPPMYTTDKRISFRPITLERIDQIRPSDTDQEEVPEEEVRPMFLKQPARYGPNAPEKLPGRKRDRDRAARRAERMAAGMQVDEKESGDEGMEVDSHEPASLDSFTGNSDPTSTATPGAGPSTSTSNSHRSISSPTHPNSMTPIGRPRTRPTIEITSLPELAHLDINALPPNIRIMVLPHVIHELDPTPSSNDAIHLPKKPLEFTKGQIKKLVNGPSSTRRKIQGRRFEHLLAGEEGASLPSSYSPVNSSPGHEGGGMSTPTRTGAVLEKVVAIKHRQRERVEVPQFVVAGEPSPTTGRRLQETEPGAPEGQGDVDPEMRLDVSAKEDAESRARNE